MTRVICLILIFLGFLSTTNLRGEKDGLPVRISIADEKYIPGESSTRECIMVFPDHSYHLEVRRQAYPAPGNDLKIFEARLTPLDSRNFDNYLLGLASSKLTDFTLPGLPLSISVYKTMTVKVAIDGSERTFGYIEWPNKDAKGSPNNSSGDRKLEWRKSAEALLPLHDWLDTLARRSAGFISLDLSASNLCEF